MRISKDQHICILGFGTEGKTTLDYLLENGFSHITVCDQNNVTVPDGIEKIEGDIYMDNLGQFDHIFRSPGIHYLHPKLQPHANIITSATKLFFDLWKGKTIGVTGTKGKGTTSALIYEILKKAGKSVFLGGNIGVNPLSFVKESSEDAIAVLELSSFQLQDLDKSPNIAVVLMITSEHLDVHSSLEEYVSAKENIFTHQENGDTTVIVSQFPTNKHLCAKIKCAKLEVNTEGKIKNGLFIESNAIKVLHKDCAKPEEIVDISEIQLKGKHNYQNVGAALAVSELLNIPRDVSREIVTMYTGLPHRLQTIHQTATHTFIDDSFSTTPETAIAAIESMYSDFIIIAGGSSKKSDFSEFVAKLEENPFYKGIILLGNDEARTIEKLLTDKEKAIHAHSMEEAVKKSLEKENTTVLLSPAAASFDLFSNYKERGKAFDKWVKILTKSTK